MKKWNFNITAKIDKWIYETPDGKVVYKRPLNKRSPKFLVLSLKYPNIPPVGLN